MRSPLRVVVGGISYTCLIIQSLDSILRHSFRTRNVNTDSCMEEASRLVVRYPPYVRRDVEAVVVVGGPLAQAPGKMSLVPDM